MFSIYFGEYKGLIFNAAVCVVVLYDDRCVCVHGVDRGKRLSFKVEKLFLKSHHIIQFCISAVYINANWERVVRSKAEYNGFLENIVKGFSYFLCSTVFVFTLSFYLSVSFSGSL